jgi:hypothetical protein
MRNREWCCKRDGSRKGKSNSNHTVFINIYGKIPFTIPIISQLHLVLVVLAALESNVIH